MHLILDGSDLSIEMTTEIFEIIMKTGGITLSPPTPLSGAKYVVGDSTEMEHVIPYATFVANGSAGMKAIIEDMLKSKLFDNYSGVGVWYDEDDKAVYFNYVHFIAIGSRRVAMKLARLLREKAIWCDNGNKTGYTIDIESPLMIGVIRGENRVFTSVGSSKNVYDWARHIAERNTGETGQTAWDAYFETNEFVIGEMDFARDPKYYGINA